MNYKIILISELLDLFNAYYSHRILSSGEPVMPLYRALAGGDSSQPILLATGARNLGDGVITRRIGVNVAVPGNCNAALYSSSIIPMTGYRFLTKLKSANNQ
jgi:hypothetical protein